MTENEPTKSELAQRVEHLEAELEATKAQQEAHQNRLQQIMPNRRQALRGLGLLGAGGLLGATGGSASASTGAAGPIGTQSDRPTIYGDDGNFNSVSTESVNNTVWSDQYNSLQDALNALGTTGVVVVQDTYSELISLSSDNRKLSGISNQSTGLVVNDSTNPALSITNRGAILEDLKLQNDGSANSLTIESAANEAAIRGIKCFNAPVAVDGDRCIIVGNDFGGEDVTVNGSNNVIVGNIRTGTITDNGTDNQIGQNG